MKLCKFIIFSAFVNICWAFDWPDVTVKLEDLITFPIRAVEFFVAAVLLILVILIFRKLKQYFNFVKQ
ncbi:unnamed protein product [Allacma fusca]|uniref:Uncharacterized protein n=1 Tax=Allacma fusca TaxID=39272 RepID=A0A8J2L571_9HEXA|nr:unnamed protein product [Allacma fusca]